MTTINGGINTMLSEDFKRRMAEDTARNEARAREIVERRRQEIRHSRPPMFRPRHPSDYEPDAPETELAAEQPRTELDASPEKPKAVEIGWPIIDEAAYHGFAGRVVRIVEPHSEADPVAILIQLLVCVGNVFGRSHYYLVEGTRHHGNLFAALVGKSSKARKGTAWGRVIAIIKIADQLWTTERTKGGLSSGEGLINEVRDEVKKWEPREETYVVVDPGVKDKRLTIVEPEFAGALAVMERHGNTISPNLRRAWDGDTLTSMTKGSPGFAATGAHISVVGHITEVELKARLTRTETANGFANRFLFVAVKRSKLLPFGGELSDSAIKTLGDDFSKIFTELPRDVQRVTMTEAAKEAWEKVYSKLSADRPGLLGAVTARAEAQVVRLALIYALLDGQTQMDAVHIEAALAVWEYCEASAARIFGSSLGDPVADEILLALRNAGAGGMTRTAIRDLFARNQSADRIGAALALLMNQGTARMEGRESGGRPVEVWFAITKEG
jgi:hypothetical protein